MDQAIYEPVTGKIFGVRGQWLMQIGASSGVLENALRFADVGGVSSLTAIGTSIFIATSFTPSNDTSTFTPFPDRDIYVVDANTFTVSGRFHIGTKLTFRFLDVVNSYLAEGFHNLLNFGGKVYGLATSGDLFNVDPANIAGYKRVSFGSAQDIALDTTNNVLWIADQGTPQIWCQDTDFVANNDCFDTNHNLWSLSGITYNSAQNKVYAVKGAEDFYKVNASAAMPGFNNFAASTLHTGRINANPYRIKSVNNLPGNPLNGKVLIPTWADDAVIVWDPFTDSILNPATDVKTGFTAPFDIVSTPTKNWAVQSGVTGLKEII